MARKKGRKAPYMSGYCMFAPHQYPCKGEFLQGSHVTPRLRLCSCECHGDYTERMIAAGLVIEEVEDEETPEDDD